jgi:hypothetical protein
MAPQPHVSLLVPVLDELFGPNFRALDLWIKSVVSSIITVGFTFFACSVIIGAPVPFAFFNVPMENYLPIAYIFSLLLYFNYQPERRVWSFFKTLGQIYVTWACLVFFEIYVPHAVVAVEKIFWWYRPGLALVLLVVMYAVPFMVLQLKE